jgi:YidC/Oxa1 family membrane protein insertase
MDKKTFAQFLIFCTLVLVAWWTAMYLVRRSQPTEPAVLPQPAGQPAAVGAQPGPEGAAPAQPQDIEVLQPAVQPEPQEVVLSNGTIKTYWTSRGASLTRLELLDKRYRAPYKEGDTRPVLALLQDFQRGLYSDTLESVTFFGRGPANGLTEAALSSGNCVYDLVEHSEQGATFQATLGDHQGHKLLVRKTVSLDAGSHHYAVTLDFENASSEPFAFACTLRGPAGIERESLRPEYTGTRVAICKGPGKYDIVRVKPGDLRKGPQTNESTDIAWAAVVNHYFVAVVEPEDRQWVAKVVSEAVTDTDILLGLGRWGRGAVRREADRPGLARQDYTFVIHTAQQRLEPAQRVTQRYRVIAAPKEDRILEAYNAGLPDLVEFGMLPTVSRLTIAVLNGVYAVVRNYGVAILVVTLIIRAILHPLTRKSQLSMAKMQKLQPQILDLQKKYANDKQKLTQEQWQLFRTYGVRPWSGCWPVFLQMPVLIALFGALRAAIELRHAGFLWVDDLSQPDTLFRFPFYLPVFGNEFNLLPILMAGVMFLNQQFTPPPTGEQAQRQQRMMKFFPMMLALLFYSMPSGLSLYFMASTAVGMFERWLIDKTAGEIKLRPAAEPARSKRPTPMPAKAGKETTWGGFKAAADELVRKLTRPASQTKRRDGKK